MADLEFGGGGDAFVVTVGLDRVLRIAPGGTVSVWTAADGGVQITTLRTVAGVAIPGGMLVADAFGQLPRFVWPAATVDQVWVEDGSPATARQRLVAANGAAFATAPTTETIVSVLDAQVADPASTVAASIRTRARYRGPMVTSASPPPGQVSTTTTAFEVGDQVTHLGDLAVCTVAGVGDKALGAGTGGATFAAVTGGKVPESQKGEPGGVAPLGPDGLVPASNLPEILAVVDNGDGTYTMSTSTGASSVDSGTPPGVVQMVMPTGGDDDAVLAAALAGADVVTLLGGATYNATTVTVPAGKTLRSQGGLATLRMKASSAGAFVRLDGSGSRLLDVRIDGNRANQTSTSAIPLVVNNVGGAVEDVTVQRCRIVGGFDDGARVIGTVRGLRFEHNEITDCGGSGLSVNLLAGSDLAIRHNRVLRVAQTAAGVGLQVYGETSSPRYDGVDVSHNTVADMGATGIPIEVTGAQRFTIVGNIVRGVGTRGISMGGLYDGAVTGNSVSQQSRYGFELNVLTRVTLTGNHVRDCGAGFSGQGGADLLIEGNSVHVTRATDATPHGVFMQGSPTSRLTVRGNTFTDVAGQGVRVSNASTDVVVEGNTFIWTPGASLLPGALIAVIVHGWQRAYIQDNIIHTALAGGGGVTVGLIHVAATGSVDVRVRRNTIRSTMGAVLALAGVAAGAVAAAGLRVEDNEVVQLDTGIRLNALTNSDVAVVDNRAQTCTTPENLAAGHTRNTRRDVESNAVPTVGAWRQGDRVWRTDVGAGTSPGWVCVIPGTPGTWRAMAALAA